MRIEVVREDLVASLRDLLPGCPVVSEMVLAMTVRHFLGRGQS